MTWWNSSAFNGLVEIEAEHVDVAGSVDGALFDVDGVAEFPCQGRQRSRPLEIMRNISLAVLTPPKFVSRLKIG